MNLSRPQYAKHRGCSKQAVDKAVREQRITLEPDGKINPAKADAEWTRNTNAAHPRGAKVGDLKPVPKAAIKAVDETLREDGGDPAPGGEMSFMRARMANEVLKAQTARVRLEKMKGQLVDRAKATTMVFDLARRERDAWIGWPARVSANMAAELGIEAHALEHVLDRYLRKQLADMAEIKLDVR